MVVSELVAPATVVVIDGVEETVMESLSMSNPVTFEDASLITVEI